MSTVRLAEVTAIDVLDLIPQYFIYVALLAWGVVGVGLVR